MNVGSQVEGLLNRIGLNQQLTHQLGGLINGVASRYVSIQKKVLAGLFKTSCIYLFIINLFIIFYTSKLCSICIENQHSSSRRTRTHQSRHMYNAELCVFALGIRTIQNASEFCFFVFWLMGLDINWRAPNIIGATCNFSKFFFFKFSYFKFFFHLLIRKK